MIAPDVDAQTFRELFLRSGKFKNRTMYLSNHDLALGFSRILHSRTPRAGDAKREYVVAEGLDTVDASPLSAGLIGHSYYQSSQLMFDDLGEVLQGKVAKDRTLDRCELEDLKRKKTNPPPAPLPQSIACLMTSRINIRSTKMLRSRKWPFPAFSLTNNTGGCPTPSRVLRRVGFCTVRRTISNSAIATIPHPHETSVRARL